MTRNQLEYRAQNEARRANLAKERLQRSQMEETHRANLEQERLGQLKSDRDYEVSLRNAIENERSNLAREKETNRSNLAKEQETHRYNVVYLDEVSRHNKAMEGAQYAQVSLGYAQLGEATRHNQAMEKETERSNRAQITESARSSMERAYNERERNKEAARHNAAMEAQASLDSSRKYETDNRRTYYDYELRNRQMDQEWTLGVWRNVNESAKTATQAVKTFAGFSVATP